jgi:LmbE family N-acetylglucosaminyl deacetylase
MPAGDVLDRMSGLPFGDIDVIAPGTSLILAPHADDESLGCGGLIAGLCDRGRPPLIVAVTDGAGSHPNSAAFPPARLKQVRADELRAACAILGLAADRISFLDFPDTRAPSDGPVFDRAVAAIAALVRQHRVSTIFATWRHDPHCDHDATAAIARAAARATGARVKFYPVWGWLLPRHQALTMAPVAGARVDITAYVERKRRAIEAHASQYSDLIDDDPGGFRLPADLLAQFSRPFEVFLDE